MGVTLAALKQKRYADAIKLAIRAGEELAGDSRQRTLLRDNVNLIAPLQDTLRVQELAFRQILASNWDGSANVYSAALLSSIESFRGEALNYLRSADKWLWLQLERRNRTSEVKIDDVAILMLTRFNLFGAHNALDFLQQFQKASQLPIALIFVRRLLDMGQYDSVESLARVGHQNQSLIIAVAHELLEIGRFISPQTLLPPLHLLCSKRRRIPSPENSYNSNPIPAAIISFAEACAVQGLPSSLILRVLNHYAPARTDAYIGGSHQEQNRAVFLRAIALRLSLREQTTCQLDDFLRPKWLEDKLLSHEQESVTQFRQTIGGLLPWYLLRARLLLKHNIDFQSAIAEADKFTDEARKGAWRERDRFSFELSAAKVQILIAARELGPSQVKAFIDTNLGSNQSVWVQDRIKLAHAAYRLEHLEDVRQSIEQLASKVVDSEITTESAIRADWYSDLARAVIVSDRADAAAYFEAALTAISRFGDELPLRWEAIASIAASIPDGTELSAELAYRFTRCAEMVGDEVEINRNQTVATCARLAPASAFAALSRWRDRDVGNFAVQLPALAETISSSASLSPQASWALSAFFPNADVTQLAVTCIKRAKSVEEKKRILKAATHQLRLGDAKVRSWEALKQAVADEPEIDTGEIDQLLAFFASMPKEAQSDYSSSARRLAQSNDIAPTNWDAIFEQLVLTTEIGLSEAMRRFRQTDDHYLRRAEFWQQVYSLLPENGILLFLKALVSSDVIGYYGFFEAVRLMPQSLREKRSVQHRGWNDFLKLFAQHYAVYLAQPRSGFEYAIRELSVDEAQTELIQDGVFEGLASLGELTDAVSFFGFADVGARCIEPEEAMELLDFAIGRLEQYIEPERADGEWDTWLQPPSLTDSLAGFIWSALASPVAAVRWQAAHCVRRLAEGGCSAEIDALIDWLARGEVGCFGSHNFPFYELHARLYLFIALARVTLDDPTIVRKNAHVFVQHALDGIEHILIELFSAEIALNIEHAYPDTYDAAIIDRLRQIGVSPFPNRETKQYHAVLTDTPWHEKGTVDLDLEFRFGMDIRGYWFEPLGHKFGVSAEQVEQLARQVIVKDWHVANDGSFHSDPRARLWESYRYQQYIGGRTQSLPLIDTYNFYLSYHSMFTVASRLVKALPVVDDPYDDEIDRWSRWLSQMRLTRNDGRWLADRRDYPPLHKPNWFYNKRTAEWRQQIVANDFLNAMLINCRDELWLPVAGHWSFCDREREESYLVSSALVVPAASQSLLIALTTCPDPYDFKLPDYEESHMEFSISPFELTGWVWRPDIEHHLDGYDPFAAKITYPPHYIGDKIIGQMNLITDIEHRNWYVNNSTVPSATCELWSDEPMDPEKDALIQGHRLTASFDFLTELCRQTGHELIFEFSIKRGLRNQRYSSDPNDPGSTHRIHRIYLLSDDGILRDIRTRYQLRGSVG